MHPIERLRYVARWGGAADASDVATEAAEALGALAFDRRALVLACQRLLEARPEVAPLWWVTAHVLGAADPAAAARACARRLADDETGVEVTYGVPSGALVAVEAASLLVGFLRRRPDCSLRLFGADEDVAGVDGVSVALVEAKAASPTRLRLSGVGTALVSAVHGAPPPGVEVWVAAPVGRVLPEALFDRCAAGAASDEVVPASVVDKVAGPAGLLPPAEGLDPLGCPVPSSLAAGPRR